MKADPKELGTCDACQQNIPKVFLKDFDCPPACGVAFCRVCWEETVGKSGKAPLFFTPEEEGRLAELRRSVPKFPEYRRQTDVNTAAWSEEFAIYATRKAAWYGYKSPFEFLADCLGDDED